MAVEGIPAVLWGTASDRLFIAVHGDQSHKEDDAIAILAEEAADKGYRTLSFDLPEHGGRKGENRVCNVQNCMEDLSRIMIYAHTVSEDISLFGCSLGAYFSMMAYKNEPIRQALFLPPVVDMQRIIENMMLWFDVSKERLKTGKEVVTPIKTLYWDYDQYVVGHPVERDKPTAILYGQKDTLCEYEYIKNFADCAHVDLTGMDDGERFFHTSGQMLFFQEWLGGVMQ